MLDSGYEGFRTKFSSEPYVEIMISGIYKKNNQGGLNYLPVPKLDEFLKNEGIEGRGRIIDGRQMWECYKPSDAKKVMVWLEKNNCKGV